ncbi:MAG TPA: hypothetical protein IGS52_14655 [Oscillatoriaceae cyanobacterium M33_DOE_052]|uniref:Uncharacterized protein n=1 Tax=Planktothricoides sp. SpSt-374 TaxID=2282167 RepID=A0A7C3ZJI4_9CYAN|nr:hypothetical protein [Oscillatoriaceae cyanobacterium M33_DOE_052]
MVRSVEQIEKEIGAISQATKELRAEFQRAYLKYLTALGRSVRQQLILAVYYTCTKAYPQSFVGMSLKQQQQLQENIRKIANEAQKNLQLLLDVAPEQVGTEQPENHEAEISEKLGVGTSGNNDAEILKLAQKINFVNQSSEQTNPQELWQWQEKLEFLIIETLEFTSRRANLGLQQLGIFPKQVSEVLIEAAAKVASYPEINRQGGVALVGEALGTPSQPNILNLTVEIPKDAEAVVTKGHLVKEEKPFNIITINLRLHEIEFADSVAMAYRQEIRELVSKLTVLKRDYHKKEQSLIIAKAEAAWRAIWFDE